MGENPKVKKNGLNFITKMALAELIKKDYAARGETDEEFAAYATPVCGREVTCHNVQGLREALGIPSTREVKRELLRGSQMDIVPQWIVDALVRVEKRITALEKAMGLAQSE